MNPATVTDNEARSRFELVLDGGAIAFINYVRSGRVRVLTHAEVPVQLRGAGNAARLTAGALDLLRARGEQVVARCPYVARFISRHREYADLLAGAASMPLERR
jgi:uncharacterized protein